MIVKLNLTPAGLIQNIRIGQAIMEAGVTLSIGKIEQRIYASLEKTFDLDYTLKDTDVIADVESNHPKPFVRVGKETRTLLFPKAVPRKLRKFWNDSRKGISFTGLVPEHRVAVLKEWEGRAKINATTRGRSGLQRYWDEPYFKSLGSSEFVLCPKGGYPWSYRFFEACLCGATPIVETDIECYEGFYYHRWNDVELIRTNVIENYKLAVERLTMPHSVIVANV